MTAFKLGRKPAVRPAALKDLAVYATGVLPAPPPVVAAPTVAYPIDGNATYGDCVMAGTDHLVRAWRALYGDYGVLPSEEQIVAEYLRLSPSDEGLVEAEVLKLWRGAGLGLYGGQIRAYCPVPPKDGLQLYQAIAFYGGAMFGIECPESCQEQFANGEPWTYVPGSPILGGHCIIALGYDNHGNIECATWGGIATVTPSFLARYLDEAWVVLSHQLVENKGDNLGLDLAALEADLERV